MSTDLRSIRTSMVATIAAVERLNGTPWVNVEGTNVEPQAVEDGKFRVLPNGHPTPQEDFGYEREQVFVQKFYVELNRLMAGDEQEEDFEFLDEARLVGDAIEGAEYPAGVEAVFCDAYGDLKRDSGNTSWAVVVLDVRVRYRAAFSPAT